MSEQESYGFKGTEVVIIRYGERYSVWSEEKLVEFTTDMAAAVMAFVEAVQRA